MGTYRNPDPVVANTGSAVYAGIQKLAGDVYNFANAERKRKGEIIGKSLAEQQAIDDNVNKLGLNIGEGASPMDKQVFEEAQATKQRIAEQYNLMARTFATPTQIAESKAEIARLNKYPEQLVADLSTGKYLVDQYNEAIRNAPGSKGSISMTNNADVLQVIQDMRDGGKNTIIETGASGVRSLVTTIDGKKSELNITSITNGLKSNPNYQLFKGVVDDSSTADTFKAAAFGPKPNKLDLISSGALIENKETDTAGMVITSYTVDDRIAKAPVNKLADSLIDDPKNYDYVNSIWQDKMGVTGDINLAIAEFGKDKVKEEIVNHYYEQVKKNLSGDLGGLTFKRAVVAAPEEPKINDSLRQLATGFGEKGKKGSGVAQVKVGTTTYKIMGTKLADQMVTPVVSEIDAKGGFTGKLIPDTEGAFNLYELDEKGNVKIKNGKPVLNYGAWQATTQK